MRGIFAWFDLRTTDTEAAWAFYQNVVGFGRQPFEGSHYHMLVSEAEPIGGVEPLPEAAQAMGAPAHWLAYVTVDDVDATAAKAEALGGRVLTPPEDIPGVGRFAVIADPTGPVLAAFRGNDPAWRPSEDVVPGAPVWHECYAGDLERAWAFYTALFGWEQADSMQMGPGLEYRIYRRPGEERSLGGMMTRTDALEAPGWIHYFHVDDITAAAQRVTEAGGEVLHGPMPIPGGEFTAICLDPQGAAFALHSRVRS